MVRRIVIGALTVFVTLFVACSLGGNLEDLRPRGSQGPQEAKQYTVTFNADGGTPAPTPQTVDEGGKVSEPPAMTKSDYTFDGWYRESTFVNQWDFANDTVTANITLYAKWNTNTIKTYIVIFNANGAVQTPAQQTVNEGGKVSEPPAIIRTGYIFSGWYRGNTSDNQWDFANDTVTANIILYAQWNPISYTVVYNKNASNAEGITQDSTHTYDVTMFLTANGYTRSGYTFTGWNSQADGLGTNYTNSQSVRNLASTADAVVTLYAQWGINMTIIFAQITDAAPSITGPTIYRSDANGQTAATLTVDNPDQYDNIEWYIPLAGISGSGSSFTLNSANTAYNRVGSHFLTIEVIKNGIPYSQTITFTVAP